MSRIEPGDPAFDPAEWDADSLQEELSKGIELFDAGEYEEAHERFERLWLSTQGSDSDFYKGLVQAAIALHHFRRGNLEGAAKLHAGHRALLAAYSPRHLGIDVADFLRQMHAALGPVVRRGPGPGPRFDPERRPRIRGT